MRSIEDLKGRFQLWHDRYEKARPGDFDFRRECRIRMEELCWALKVDQDGSRCDISLKSEQMKCPDYREMVR